VFFSTYKRISYVGMVLFPFLTYGLFYAAWGSANTASSLALVLTLLVVPFQFLQFRLLQNRLDENEGSLPMSLLFDWELEDDSDEEDATSDEDSAAFKPRRCASCGLENGDAKAFRCAHCGAFLS
jgi:hypothetical protein